MPPAQISSAYSTQHSLSLSLPWLPVTPDPSSSFFCLSVSQVMSSSLMSHPHHDDDYQRDFWFGWRKDSSSGMMKRRRGQLMILTSLRFACCRKVISLRSPFFRVFQFLVRSEGPGESGKQNEKKNEMRCCEKILPEKTPERQTLLPEVWWWSSQDDVMWRLCCSSLCSSPIFPSVDWLDSPHLLLFYDWNSTSSSPFLSYFRSFRLKKVQKNERVFSLLTKLTGN